MVRSQQEVRTGLKMLGAAVAFVCVSMAHAQTFTWKGGANGDWTLPSNWEPNGLPGASDTIVLNGAANNNATGLTVGGIQFLGDSTYDVSGNAITVANGGSVYCGCSQDITVHLPLILGTAKTPAVSLGCKNVYPGIFNLYGVISGPADITVECTGRINLRGANTFDGDLTLKKGLLYAYVDGAFGSTTGWTKIAKTANDGTSIAFLKVTTAENFYVDTQQLGTGLDFWGDSLTPAYLNGNITQLNKRHESWSLRANSEVHLGGTVSDIACFCSTMSAGSKLYLEKDSYWNNTWYLWANASATVFVNAPMHFVGNDGKMYGFKVDGGTYKFQCDNGLCDAENCPGLWYQSEGTIDLCGHDLYVRNIRASKDCGVLKSSSQAATLHITAQSPTLLGETSSKLSCIVQDGVTVSTEGPLPLVVNRINTSTGSLIASNGGEIRLETSGAWVGSDVTLRGGSKLYLTARHNLSDRTALVIEDEDSTVNLADGVTILAKSVTLPNGESLPAGLYGSVESELVPEGNRYPYFKGKGAIVAMGGGSGVSATWTSPSGSSSFADENNWANGTSAATPKDNATFAAATAQGLTANLTTPVVLSGIKFANVESFTIGGSGRLGLCGAGIDVSGPSDSARYEISAPLAVVTEQTWQLNKGRLVISGGVDGVVEGGNVAKRGTGMLELCGNVNLPGGLTVREGAATFNQMTLTGPVTLNSNELTADGTENLVDGSISAAQGHINLYNGAKLTITGGINDINTGWTAFWFGRNGSDSDPTATGTVVVTNEPLKSVSSSSEIYVMGPTELVLAAPSNGVYGVVRAYGTGEANRSVIRCRAPWAFAYTCKLALSQYVFSPQAQSCATFDLGGYDQGFTEACIYEKDNDCVVTSESPAYLHGQNPSTRNCYWSFEGAAGFSLEGTGEFIFRKNSPSAGSLRTTAGRLVMGENGFWPNCTNVVAEGTGTFVLNHRDAISTDAVVGIKDSGKIEIAAGTRQKVSELWIDGKKMPGGRYGATVGSMPPEAAGHFAGSGVLSVKGAGLFLLVK